MSELIEKIQSDIKTAMKSGDKATLGTLRQITAAIKQKEVDERVTPGDEDVIGILDKMIKQRRESISQFSAAGRTDLQQVEEQEIVVIEKYMPAKVTEAELESLIATAIAETGASSMKEMGKVMGLLKPQLQGRADMGAVSARIKALLTGG